MLQNPELHYLDNAATTIVDPAVAEAVYTAMLQNWANPSSLYAPGAESEAVLNRARAAVAATLGCKGRELFFTSCGSEGNNMAVFGAAKSKTFGRRIVVSGFEHPSVQRPMEQLAAEGYEVVTIAPEPDGRLDVDKMIDAVDKNTILAACMLVNNETGARNDVEKLAAGVKKKNSRTAVHVDAVQAWMRIPIRLDNIDTLSVSGHKIHAPKGVGALYISDRYVQSFRPPYLGGEQEREKRPGTENLPYAVGLAAAAQKLAPTMAARDATCRALNEQLRRGLAAFPEVVVNSPAGAVPEVLNFSENCIKSETMLTFLAEKQIYVSSASACGRGRPSRTLAAMGKDPLAVDTAIRVSFCADNTPEDVQAFLDRFAEGMRTLQRIRR
jgi:cysteine desulfurase